GCECATPGCCATACQTTHMNGLGQKYYDCTALGTPGIPSTYTGTMATEAADAWTTSVTATPCQCGTGASAPRCYYKQTATACAVWLYTGGLAGYVHLEPTSSCICPGSTDPTWN